jgi:O-antigen/teichoic acid export membrane protein
MNILVPATFVSGVIGSGVFVDTSETISRDEDPRERIELGIGFASILAIPILFGAIAMPVDIVTTIYGAQYREAGTVLVILALYKLLETQTDQLFGAISGLDRPDIRFYISLGVLVMNVGLGIPLAYRMGLMGVVIATLVTAVAQWIAALYLSQKLISFKSAPKPILEQFAAGVVMFLVVFPAHRVYGVGWWGDLIGLVTLGATVYGLVLLAISPMLRGSLRSLINDMS